MLPWDSHNKFRLSKNGNSSLKNTIEWIRASVDSNIQTRVLTTLTNYNINDLIWIWELLSDLWVNEWHIWKVVNAWRARFIYKELIKWVSFGKSELNHLKKLFPNLKIQYNYPSKSSNYYALILPDGMIATQDANTWDKISLWSLIHNPISKYWNEENFDIKWHYIKWLNIQPK